MTTYEVEKIDFQWIRCLECGIRMKEYCTMFFIDEDGLNRYGAICISCKDKVSKRKNIIVHDGIMNPADMIKNTTELLKKYLRAKKNVQRKMV